MNIQAVITELLHVASWMDVQADKMKCVDAPLYSFITNLL
jgi:hypothetical protein